MLSIGVLWLHCSACLASKKIIVSCEEIVDYDIIKSSPHLTIIPGFRVNAVIEEPYGCHPWELPGYRTWDAAMINLITAAISSKAGLASSSMNGFTACRPQCVHQHYIAGFRATLAQ